MVYVVVLCNIEDIFIVFSYYVIRIWLIVQQYYYICILVVDSRLYDCTVKLTRSLNPFSIHMIIYHQNNENIDSHEPPNQTKPSFAQIIAAGSEVMIITDQEICPRNRAQNRGKNWTLFSAFKSLGYSRQNRHISQYVKVCSLD